MFYKLKGFKLIFGEQRYSEGMVLNRSSASVNVILVFN
ncbi:MAG: hypothetical protein ACI88A_004207 [Paraglaciecola sp.]